MLAERITAAAAFREGEHRRSRRGIPAALEGAFPIN
jgi:hypothetical protein